MDKHASFQEWVQFAKMDLDAAKHLNATMHPKPLEIICYHCQQAVEKVFKAILILNGCEIKRTHDLGLLAELCAQYMEISDNIYDICDNLTPYGVKIRYPQELFLEEHNANSAIKEAQIIFDWLEKI